MNRGNYKQHDYSLSNMPRSTRFRLAKKLKAQEMEELQQIYLNQPNSHIQQQQQPLIEHRESLFEQQEPLLQYQEQIIEQQATIQITNHHESNNTLIYLNEQSDDDDIDDNNEDENADSLNELLRNEITKEELAAAYLASFYSGKTTQSSLTDYLQLSNIYSPVQLPTTFNGLAQILLKRKLDFIKKKTWYCNVCQKSFENLNDRSQRECEKCGSRY